MLYIITFFIVLLESWLQALDSPDLYVVIFFVLLLVAFIRIFIDFILAIKDIIEDKEIKKINKLKKKYPNAFEKYCKDNRIHSSSAILLSRVERRRILSINLSVWRNNENEIFFQKKQRIRKIDKDFDALQKKYPNGIESWKEQNVPQRDGSYLCLPPDKQKALNEEVNISKLEKAFKDSVLFSDWEKEQEAYTDLCRDKCDTLLEGFGCYSYYVKFNKVTKFGQKENGEYMIWQFFPRSYCLEDDLDYIYYAAYMHRNKKYVENKDFVCDKDSVAQIISFVKFLNEENNDDSVYFRDARNECANEDIVSAYAPIYSSLYDIIADSRIYDYPINNAIGASTMQKAAFDIWKKNVSSKIVVIDYATQNEELIQFCENLITNAQSQKPLITYISLMKCFSREEMQSIIEEDKKQIEEEKKKEEKECRRKEALEAKKKRILSASNSWAVVKGIHHYFFYYYYPISFTDVTTADKIVRSMIYNFKDGKQHKQVCNLLVKKLKDTYGDGLDLMTFVCIPASTRSINKDRYEFFMKEVCSKTGMRNGYEHVTIIREKEPSHLGGESDAEFDYDEDFFKDSFVILFDDVVTRGHSLFRMKRELENYGATIVGAISIGRTYSDYGGAPRLPHPYLLEHNITET